MPPKNMPLPAQQPSVQDLGINVEYMLPHQRDQYRKHLGTMNDLQSRKAKEPNNPQLEAAINEARNQLGQLAAAAAQNEKQYPTQELFAQYVNQYHQTIQQRRNEITGGASTQGDQVRALQTRIQQLTTRLKELDALIQKPGISEEDRTLFRNEYQRIGQQYQGLKQLFDNNQAQARTAAANPPSSQPESTVSTQPGTPPVSQTQPPTPTIRNAPPSQQIQMQQSSSQPSLPPTASMGQIPRPSVNTSVPPARPTLTGGYPVGNPLLGTTSPAGIPHAFHLAQDGDARLLSKRKLQDLVKSIDPDERLEPDVEELLMEVADEFIDSVLQQSCKIARHRKGQMLEVRDVQLHLERNWNIRIPGYSSEEVRGVKKYNPTPAHAAKVGAVNQSKAMTKE
jgi:transcription initiation factor TFIID subunit 12